MEAQLKIVSGPFTGHVIPMPKGKFLIGRESDCQCVLDNLAVSRHHCVLLLDDWTLRIRDLGSKNGTLVNRSRIRPGETILSHGDVVTVGTWEAQVDLRPVDPRSKRSADTEALDTSHFESDTTQLDITAPRPAELKDER